MKIKALILLVVLNIPTLHAEHAHMTSALLVSTITDISDAISVSDNTVEFTYQDVPIVLVYDESANRMRLMTPVIEAEALDENTMSLALQASFASLRDARYAIADGVMWALFLHPLEDLSEALLIDAINQVAAARGGFSSDETEEATETNEAEQ